MSTRTFTDHSTTPRFTVGPIRRPRALSRMQASAPAVLQSLEISTACSGGSLALGRKKERRKGARRRAVNSAHMPTKAAVASTRGAALPVCVGKKGRKEGAHGNGAPRLDGLALAGLNRAENDAKKRRASAKQRDTVEETAIREETHVERLCSQASFSWML